jgi:hypothetical protein
VVLQNVRWDLEGKIGSNSPPMHAISGLFAISSELSVAVDDVVSAVEAGSVDHGRRRRSPRHRPDGYRLPSQPGELAKPTGHPVLTARARAILVTRE